MIKAGIIAVALASAVSLAAGPAWAAGFECDLVPTADGPPGITDIRLLWNDDPLDHPAELNAAVDTLRTQGMSRTLIIDNLIAAYCPIVAANSSLADPQKVSRVQSFAARITRIVYAIEDTDEIVLDIPFAPDTVDAIRAKAHASGITAEAWIVETIDAMVKSGAAAP